MSDNLLSVLSLLAVVLGAALFITSTGDTALAIAAGFICGIGIVGFLYEPWR